MHIVSHKAWLFVTYLWFFAQLGTYIPLFHWLHQLFVEPVLFVNQLHEPHCQMTLKIKIQRSKVRRSCRPCYTTSPAYPSPLILVLNQFRTFLSERRGAPSCWKSFKCDFFNKININLWFVNLWSDQIFTTITEQININLEIFISDRSPFRSNSALF